MRALQDTCEEYRAECERAIDERGQLAEELVRLRVEARELRAEVQALRLRASSGSGGDDDGDGGSSGGGMYADAATAAGSLDWWRAKCRHLARANDVLAQRLDGALGQAGAVAGDDDDVATAAGSSSSDE